MCKEFFYYCLCRDYDFETNTGSQPNCESQVARNAALAEPGDPRQWRYQGIFTRPAFEVQPNNWEEFPPWDPCELYDVAGNICNEDMTTKGMANKPFVHDCYRPLCDACFRLQGRGESGSPMREAYSEARGRDRDPPGGVTVPPTNWEDGKWVLKGCIWLWGRYEHEEVPSSEEEGGGVAVPRMRKRVRFILPDEEGPKRIEAAPHKNDDDDNDDGDSDVGAGGDHRGASMGGSGGAAGGASGGGNARQGGDDDEIVFRGRGGGGRGPKDGEDLETSGEESVQVPQLSRRTGA